MIHKGCDFFKIPLKPEGFTEHLQYQALSSGIHTSFNLALNGDSFEEAGISGIRSFAAGVAGGYLSSQIGILNHGAHLDGFLHKALHGGVGAGAALIAGNDPLIAGGGAMIGETVGELYRDAVWGSDKPPLGVSQKDIENTTRIGTALAQITAGTAAALLGQSPSIAAHAAEVAVRNNCFRIDIQMELERERREMLRQAGIDEVEEERIELDFLRETYSFVEKVGERNPTFWRGVGQVFEGVEWVMEQVNEAIPPLAWLNQGIGYGIESWVNSKASVGRTPEEVEANARALSGLIQLGSRSTLFLGGVTAGARGVLGRMGRSSHMPKGILIGEESTLPGASWNRGGLITSEEVLTEYFPQSALQRELLKNYLMAEEIGGGHALEKHIVINKEYPDWIRTRKQLVQHIEFVLNNSTDIKMLQKSRVAYWHEPSGTVVIRNPHAVDGGTVFQPREGKAYFDRLR